jgi:hypothetical protein
MWESPKDRLSVVDRERLESTAAAMLAENRSRQKRPTEARLDDEAT